VDVVAWLLDSDPAIRWQVMRDLTDAPDAAVAAERARVATEGWGARLLALQSPDGHWSRDAPTFTSAAGANWWRSMPPERRGTLFPAWTSSAWTLHLLRDLGIDPASAGARRAVARVRENCRWEHDGEPFFEGEVEPCINGGALALGAYFGRASESLARRLVGEQLEDGGWNCEAPKSTRSSFHTTICVLEGLLEYERAIGSVPEIAVARRRGEEYLLERCLFRRFSTGEVANPAFLKFAFPPRYHYDVLRALDYFRDAGVQPDARVRDALRVVESRRQADGRWLLDDAHDEALAFPGGESIGAPSRWNTLRALRVLRWYDRRA